MSAALTTRAASNKRDARDIPYIPPLPKTIPRCTYGRWQIFPFEAKDAHDHDVVDKTSKVPPHVSLKIIGET